MQTTLEALKAQLKAVASDLDGISRAQASEWHLDRVEEARWLVAQIEKLEK